MSVQAFDDAIAELDTLSEESYKDSTLIMQVALVEMQKRLRRVVYIRGHGADIDDRVIIVCGHESPATR